MEENVEKTEAKVDNPSEDKEPSLKLEAGVTPLKIAVKEEKDQMGASGGVLGRVKLISIAFLVILLGVASGYVLSARGLNLTKGSRSGQGLDKEEIGKKTIVGIDDEKTFRDTTEGVLNKGGLEGEGSHHLVRPGGESQNVYLTSSVIDLDKFVDRKVKVWGETFSAKKAGWLMDVGKLEVLE